MVNRAAQLFSWWWTAISREWCVQSDTSATISSISLSLAASLCVLFTKLCLSSVFVLACPQFSSNTIVQLLPRLEMYRAIWKWWIWMRNTAYVLTGTSLFAQCSSPCPTSLALSPEIFLLFCRMGQGLNTKLLLWSCRDNTISYYPGFSQRQADISLPFLLTRVVNVCRLALGAEWERGISDSAVLPFKTLFFSLVPLLLWTTQL